MSPKKQLLAQFELHNVLFNNVIDQVTDEEANKSIIEPMNNFKWLAGHILSSQSHLARIGEAKVEIPWSEHFASGPGADKSAAGPKGNVPSLADIKAKWNEIHLQIKNGLENLPDEALAQKIDMKHPITPFDDTLGGLWAFLNHHQAYTIGQMGILRRGFKKEALKFN